MLGISHFPSDWATVHADEVGLEECLYQGQIYGDGRGETKIQADCYDLIYLAASPKAITEARDGSSSLVGHKNIILNDFLDESGQPSRIAISGSQSKLENVEVVDIDEVNQHLLVLQHSPLSLYTYQAKVGGNLAPIYLFESEELEGAVDFVVNPHKKEIAVLYSKPAMVKFFNIKANNQGLRPENSTKALRRLQGTTSGLQKPYSIERSGDGSKLFVLDGADKEILTFDWNHPANQPPKRSYSAKQTKLSALGELVWEEKSKRLLVETAKGETTIIDFAKKKIGRKIASLESAPQKSGQALEDAVREDKLQDKPQLNLKDQ